MELPKLPVKGYVIYSPELNLYSGGGIPSYGSIFKKKAKIWSSLGALHSHLAMFIHTKYEHIDKNFCIHTFEANYNMYDEDDLIIEISSGQAIETVNEAFNFLIDQRNKKEVKRHIAFVKKNMEIQKKALDHLSQK